MIKKKILAFSLVLALFVSLGLSNVSVWANNENVIEEVTDVEAPKETANPTEDSMKLTEDKNGELDKSVVEKEATEVKKEAAAPMTREATPNYEGTVTFVGQWVGESSKKEDTVKNFSVATDKLGAPKANDGLLRGLAKTFLGWSDKPPVENGKLAEGARLFGQEDTIEKAFPNGIPADAKLYGVYFSLNEPNTPFPGSAWNLIGLINVDQFKGIINDNKLTINHDISGEDTLPDTTLFEETDKEGIKKIVDVYEKKDDIDNINEVVLNAVFEMNKTVAMLVYRNPVGSNALRPILSFDYNTRYKNGTFGTEDGKAADYTYVDLKINLDGDIIVPDKLYLEFAGHSWRPLYVFGANKEKLNVLNPTDGSALGNDTNSFKTLVNSTSEKVTFGVETKGNRDITVRVVLREGDQEKIKEKDVVTSGDETIPEAITRNMTLRAISKTDLKTLQPGLSEKEYNASVIRVSDVKAKELADTEAEATLKISGSIAGHVVVSAGTVSQWGITLPLKSDTAINSLESSNKLELSYLEKKYNVIYTFISGTENIDLPAEVIAKQPQDEFGILKGEEITLPKFDDVKVDGGIWKFKAWHKNDENNNLVELSENPSIADDDLVLVGEWVYIADEKTPEKPIVDKTKDPKKPTNKPVIKTKGVKTGDESDVMEYVVTLLAASILVFALRRRHN
ncbi:MAG: SHIRT domain-containing protein [Eubacteriales bacterium]|nr:SHIRT domain-containing protein [Eubacteriales bacterium]MDY3333052.1 SHIRT domain-containing protein [Gallibacter sp.]